MTASVPRSAEMDKAKRFHVFLGVYGEARICRMRRVLIP